MVMTTYATEKSPWVAKQLAEIDETGDTRAAQIQGRPVTVFTVTGAKTGLLRRVPLMRVEHEGAYLLVASKGGAPEHPAWYASVTKNPEIEVHDGTEHWPARARELSGAERDTWWERAVAAFPSYADYQTKCDRLIPILLAEPVADPA